MQVAHPAESMWRTFAENCWYIHARELTPGSGFSAFDPATLERDDSDRML
jgi:hypothetical protein